MMAQPDTLVSPPLPDDTTEIGRLQAQVKDLQGLLARYQEHVLTTERLLAAYEGRNDQASPGSAGKAIMQSSTARLLELLVSRRIVRIAEQGLPAVERPWRKEMLRKPFRITYWTSLRRAQRRLKRDPALRDRLTQLDAGSR